MSELSAYVFPLLIAAVMAALGLLGNKALNAYVVAKQSFAMVNLTAILAVLLLFILVIWFSKAAERGEVTLMNQLLKSLFTRLKLVRRSGWQEQVQVFAAHPLKQGLKHICSSLCRHNLASVYLGGGQF